MPKLATSPQHAITRFQQLVAPEYPDEHIDLLRAAFAVAQAEYPQLDAGPHIARVERIARRVKQRLPMNLDARATIEAINQVFFGECGLRGNRDDYFDPRNSYLNQVLDRGLGIPITLAVLYQEVARQVEFPLVGVGMPGHFLLKHFDVNGDELLIDVFDGGKILSQAGCQQRLDDIYGGEVVLEREHLLAVTNRQILMRILNNLRQIYIAGRNLAKAVRITDLVLALHPRSAEDVKQRAVLLYSMNRQSAALKDFEQYLRLAPDASDLAEIKQMTLSIRKTLAMLN
jgi:regulator of sirC expression with transglutaminase-like and TPR domain